MRRLSDTVGGVKLFIVGQLETDSSKGTILCRVWDCLQLRAVKTPNTFLRAWPDRVFFYFLGGENGVIFSTKKSKIGGATTTPLLSAECQIKKKSALNLRATRV